MADERTIWGVHMGWQHGFRPIEQGFIAIGWSEIGDLSKIPPDRDSFKAAVSKAHPQNKPGSIPVIAGTLFKFATEIEQGDIVAYPSKPNRMINLGIVEGDYIFDPAADDKHPNRRKVKWVRQIPRAEFSQNTLYEIGSAVTLFQVRNNADEIIAALQGKKIEPAAVDEETSRIASENVEETTADFVLKRLKTNLDPYQFEHFVGHLLERMEYHARVTQKSGDSGVDIIAHKDALGFVPPIIKVQCKQILNPIGQPEVAQLYGHVQQGEYGLFVTLGEYTAAARQFERSKHNLRLITGDELVELVFDHYDQFEPRYQTLLPMKKVYIPAVVGTESGKSE